MSTVQAVPVDPSNPRNVTSFHRNEIGWSIKTPAPSLGRLDPPREWHTSDRVPNIKDPATGRDILDPNGVPIPDYQFLPRYLSSNLEWFRVEAYFREHKDMSYYHIWQRQPLGTPMPTLKERNSMNNMRLRKARRPYNARCWTKKGQYPPKILVELVEGLSQTQLLLNTTWVVTPNAIKQPGVDRFLPLTMYLDGYPAHTPSAEVRAALAESHRLQALANTHNVSHWSELPKHLLPRAWFGRTRNQQAQGAQNASNSNDDSTENELSKERANIDRYEEPGNSEMSGNDGDGRSELGLGEVEYFGEEIMQHLEEEEDIEGDTEHEDNGTHEDQAIDEDEEGINQDISGAEGNKHLWGFQDVVGVTTFDEMDGDQLFQDTTSHDTLGMEGAMRAAYNRYPSVCDPIDL